MDEKVSKLIYIHNISDEREKYIQSLVDEFGFNWAMLPVFGAAYILDLRTNINNSIFCDSYVIAYKPPTTPYVRWKADKRTTYRKMFIYWAMLGARKGVHLFFSYDEPLTYETRDNWETLRIVESNIDKRVLEEFSFGNEGLLPK